MRKILLILFTGSALLVSAQKTRPAATALKNDLTLMMQLIEGEFDNFQQAYMEKEEKYQEPHERIHSIFRKVDLPAFGEQACYVLQYLDGDSTKVYRQRIYSFKENNAENAIQLDIYSFVTDSLYYYAHQKPEKLQGLTPAVMTKTDGCAVFWKRDGDRFVGYMKDKTCTFISKRSGKRIFITDSLLLTKEELWIRDAATDEQGGYVFGHKGGVHHKLRRCHRYKGWILLQKAGFDDEYISMRNLYWHDQGKRQRLLTDDGKKTKYEVELACVIKLNAYGPGKDLEVLKLAIYEEGKDKAVAYTWASPGSKNIGINMRWFQAGLTRTD